MTRTHRRRFALLIAIHLAILAAPAAPARATQILDAADNAELAAEVSATNVNRIALLGDRIAKVVRAPDGFAVEHDGASGDLYLRPSAPAASGGVAGDPVTLFIGTEKGFTYRLTLTSADRDSAQILIRNADAVHAAAIAGQGAGEPHIAALLRLVRAVARREPLPGYAITAGNAPASTGLTVIETWRGPRFAALVFEAARPASDDADGAVGLAGTIGGLAGAGRVAALWVAARGTGPSGGRLGVAVVETAAGALR